MLNKLRQFLKTRNLLSPGDSVTCALSGGADSVAMTYAFLLLQEELDISLSAAHFNHHLRGGESDRDEAFVREFCKKYDIPLTVGSGNVISGNRGLENAAREARYAFFDTLPGPVSTAHTADDNAETLLMHLIRGSSLRGLGGIAPRRGKYIRPMLTVTRQEVLAFLEEQNLPHVEDSSNETDEFLRNRLRHGVMPLLRQENPQIGETLSRTALSLRAEEDFLTSLLACPLTVPEILTLDPVQQKRAAAALLRENHVPDICEAHVEAVLAAARSEKPSARIDLPGGKELVRCYDILTVTTPESIPEPMPLPCPGNISWGDYEISAEFGRVEHATPHFLSVCPQGEMIVRSRRTGDTITLSGGTKPLKKLLIDRKIPASLRDRIPVLSDDLGVLAVAGIGGSLPRMGGGVVLRFEKKK
ncbi:MAG: tRNA lysidine(34) synthetase TilS [Clostridiales bacterium]|nr:tRNA lysidine(34) synthetase TilS [Clostridiales bacterium]